MASLVKKKAEKKYGVTEVARRLGRSTARIRQICIARDIGICYGSKYRMLSENDVQHIRSLLRDRR